MKLRKSLTWIIILSTLIAMFPAITPTHTAEAATSTYCEFGGGADPIGIAGCSYCGGSGRQYFLGLQTGRNDIALEYSPYRARIVV